MSAGRPVARLVAPVVTRVLVLVALLAGIAVAGVFASTRAVDYLTDDLQPAAAAHQNVLQDMSDMQAAVRAYAQAGQQDALDDYRQALARLAGHQQQVRRFASSDPELDLLVAREEGTAQAWLDQYAAVRVERPGGPGTFDPQLFRTGVQRFEAFRAAHADAAGVLDADARDARDQAELRLRGTVLGVVLIAGLGLWGVTRARRRLLAELAEPLGDLELVVQRMAGRDRDVRAPANGPREVRAVAAALNDLADDQARARAVEERIQAELRALDTAKDDFVANVSHELRTPLTTISGYLELVAEEYEGRMEPRHERMVEAARRNVSRLRLLIDDLLALSTAESRDLVPEPVDLAALVREVVTDVRMIGTRRGVRIEVEQPDGELPVLGDRVMLHRALLNIVTNAVKFSRDGGRVDVDVALELGHWVVQVQDQGIGIPRAEIERLGTRFFRASNAVTNEIAGTGLGVRIVQTIVDKHGGDLVINSEEGQGTVSTLRLPAHGAAARDGEGAGHQPALAAAEPEWPERPSERRRPPRRPSPPTPSAKDFVAAVEPRRRRE